MKPFYETSHIKLFKKDCRSMDELPSESVDIIATDPPYGISFMGKDWDKALPDKTIWAECLRILKPGAFAFVMSIPRSDCLSRMIINLEDAGFNVGFSPIYWAYASGFPKAQNIGKAVDKRLGAEREVVKRIRPDGKATGNAATGFMGGSDSVANTKGEAISPQAKALDGSYGGFQPKPAVEVIIVCMKPLSEKTFVDQALKNRKGITWLDDCRIPYESENKPQGRKSFEGDVRSKSSYCMSETPEHERIDYQPNTSGRFPANLLVSDDVLNDGRVSKSTSDKKSYLGLEGTSTFADKQVDRVQRGDSGSFSRYFDLDKWAKTLPFLIVPKASKSEKNKGLGDAVPRTKSGSTPRKNEAENLSPNNHPTVKPLKLMAYLITLGSREGDTVIDNFGGSGTTAVAAQLLGRKCIMYEVNEQYCEVAADRCRQLTMI